MDYTKEDIQKECYELALHAYATSYIYSLRAKQKGKYIKAITLLGFVIPVLIGGIVSSYGLEAEISSLSITILTPIAILQLTLSCLSLIYAWDEQRSYYLESSISNRQISEDATLLAKFPNSDIITYSHSFNILMERNRSREEQDDKYPFTGKESRKGLRYSLRRFQRKCIGCNIIPLSMESSNCDICGKF